MQARKQLLVLSLASAVLLSAAARAQAAVTVAAADAHLPRYSVTVLATDKGYRDINNAGTMVGVHSAPSGELAFIERQGNLTYLGTLGGLFTTPLKLNAANVAVGWTTSTTAQLAFVYDGMLRSLGTLGGANSVATSINDAGLICGHADTSSENRHAFLYAHGAMMDLGTLGSGTYSVANGINARGQVVGESTITAAPTSPTHPFLYHQGVMIDLGSLGGNVAGAVTINDRGQVAGFATDPDENFRLFLYEQGAMRDLGSFGGFIAPIGMNNQGDIVGSADDHVTGFGFLYTKGVLTKFDALIDPALGWTISVAYAINDRGQILASGCRVDGCASLRLDPMP